ncbi:hypothetical protein [Nocardioides flavescens]|uniref:Uncharacterized protein n=1 Tax=Nocardioides flavescens TaxID=2691959 RepID=A0A6L7EW01_9ACTN|nr:hypothetical protein [Nocardioides flavescens]MXG89578.1 hypothetical protein [Nocardioides flavescens]
MPEALLDALRGLDLEPLRPRTVLYVHLHEAALHGTPAVARVEGLGPSTLLEPRWLRKDEVLSRNH